MKVLGQRFAAVGFIVLLGAMTCACSSRSTPAAASTPPNSAQPPEANPELPTAAPAPPAPVSPSQTGSVDCAVVDGPGEPVATVALAGPVEPSNAPRPSSESERLLFRQLYETLIRVDCGGYVRPGLAASWRLEADRRTWILALRENARFSDGTPVTPDDVRASWSDGGATAALRPYVSRLVESIVAIDGQRLAITLRRHRTDAPLALAHTDLAVARRIAGSPWPLGTRASAPVPERVATRAMTDSAITIEGDSLSPTRFVVTPADPRDVLDGGVDLVLTRDPAALAYAATLPHLQSVPLEWHRTHVLLTPDRPRTAPLLSDEARQALAADAVRGEARGATGPFWWQTLQDCDVGPAQPRNQSTSTARIVYDAHDSVARDLAERLVGLARGPAPAAAAILDVLLPDRPRRTYQRAVGLTGEPLARALRLGRDAGYVVGLDRRSLDPCRDMQVVMDSAHWLDPEAIVALVDTRLRAIVQRGRSGLSAEWDGGLLIARPGDAR